MNSILKICRVGPLLGLITRWHLYRVSRHADAASRSVLPRERVRSLTQLGHSQSVAITRDNKKVPNLRMIALSASRSVRLVFVRQDRPKHNPTLAVESHHLKLLVDAPIVRRS